MSFPTDPVDYQVHMDAGRTWVFIPERQTWQCSKEPPIPHKSQHLSGPDSITPAEIGAASLTQLEAVLTRLMALETRLPRDPSDYQLLHATDGTTLYLGRLAWADTGPAEDSTAWVIYKISTNSAGDVVAEQSATGAWSNKTNLQYS